MPDNVVYVVDPDAAVGEALGTLLNTYFTHVYVFADAERFLDFIDITPPRSCLFTEANLPGLSGISLVRRLRAMGRDLPVFVFSHRCSQGMRALALNYGATGMIEKVSIPSFLRNSGDTLFLDRADNNRR